MGYFGCRTPNINFSTQSNYSQLSTEYGSYVDDFTKRKLFISFLTYLCIYDKDCCERESIPKIKRDNQILTFCCFTYTVEFPSEGETLEIIGLNVLKDNPTLTGITCFAQFL
ncbi:hypothetical protein Gasu2_37830 [Galdieria sulphuraria]|uniref:Uncharacterized protein n=1 Tax=Galdieria sulphuraria TaxID=130081 RepID=M2XBX2_GALSU|nr:uncharacterized protein Gasu_51080 [Galdieria sulphuraria]EME27382.1 hypothetical protein Gasu_51080 [Galdieria sulphuraria]GJD09537.1 hypothetical protein Gasu2_37830 [Galdieria sulphuraria]|eukprot:XP_005703902.1 hypothetical protein Gasu_51080 [Galdieria sulphuraria]